jgi:hypothetical protein
MTDSRKAKLLLAITTALVALVILYSVLQDFMLPDVEGYVQRRSYYERTISKKGLSEHKGMYWKEKP